MNLTNSLNKEWVDTNGLGGYSSSTVLLCNTRKYHGLLVSSPEQSDGRLVFLSKIDPTIRIDGSEYQLGTNIYPGAVHPTGHDYVESFCHSPWPKIVYRIGTTTITQEIMMGWERPAVNISFLVESPEKETSLRLLPLFAFRDFNATATENAFADNQFIVNAKNISFTPYAGLPSVYVAVSRQVNVVGPHDWYRRFEYIREKERGYDYHEDLMSPGALEISVSSGERLSLQVSLGVEPEEPVSAYEREIERRLKLDEQSEEWARDAVAPPSADAAKQLWMSAEKFLITDAREKKPSVIAGYPWFGEWGRDAMISLPGLTLARGLDDESLKVLNTFASYEKGGLFPNQLGVHGTSSYNTVDASLWFFWAAQMHVGQTGRTEDLNGPVFEAMTRILRAYATGNVPHGTVRDDGLLEVGSEDTQLTWMDATVNGSPVTPRHGRPVEINALWYNALCFYEELSPSPWEGDLKPLASVVSSLADQFQRTFWIPERGYLADVVYPDGTVDRSIRPNQLIAVSVPNSPVSPAQMKTIVHTAEKHLLTPFGLRTLSCSHPGYRPTYRGNQDERDSAYHQGTVWPWLLGPYVDANLRVFGADAHARLREQLAPLFGDHLSGYGLGGISEVFDGDTPHAPGGCPLQAWSVAEALRVLVLVGGR